ncbi:MAG: substrate-binding domain-containing protein [Lentisphaeria bacterium]|jgi:LacI family transcriptional regulator
MRFAYVTEPAESYYRGILKGILHFVTAQGGLGLEPCVVWCGAADVLPALDAAGYDGLILGTFWETSPQARRLATPVVSVSNTHLETPFAKVVTDDREIGAAGARHLLAKGYRHLAFWGHDWLFSRQRWDGFAAAAAAALGPECRPGRLRLRGNGNGGAKRWLGRLPRPLGLMAEGDDVAAAAINLANELGWRVPEDLAVIGVNDDELFCELVHPTLSSVSLQLERIGFLAAERLLQLVRGEEIPRVTLVPPGPLVQRQSTAGIVAGDPRVAQAVRFMEEKLAGGGDVNAAARAAGLSRRMLELRFKAALGQTPHDVLARLRLDRAKELLATTAFALKQVAALCGFSGAVSFSQAFRHGVGQAPSAYRQQFRAKPPAKPGAP